VKRITFSFSLLLIMFAGAGFVAAHGGGDLIAGPVEAGPYLVSVWVNPPQPEALEPIHFTVGLAASGDGRPVLDADIQVEMRAEGREGRAVIAPATTEQSANKLFYETDMTVAEPGPYQTTFSIHGPEGEGAVALVVEVRPASKTNWLMLGLAGLGLAVVVGWLFSLRSRGPLPEAK
jgi:hypothetical protein